MLKPLSLVGETMFGSGNFRRYGVDVGIRSLELYPYELHLVLSPSLSWPP